MDAISYEDFKKLHMCIVQPIKVEPIPGKSKILRLTVDIGFGEIRTMIAGGADMYKPEIFLERKFVALINLTPRIIAGIESQGMLLAVDVDGKPIWLEAEDAPIGSRIT